MSKKEKKRQAQPREVGRDVQELQQLMYDIFGNKFAEIDQRLIVLYERSAKDRKLMDELKQALVSMATPYNFGREGTK